MSVYEYVIRANEAGNTHAIVPQFAIGMAMTDPSDFSTTSEAFELTPEDALRETLAALPSEPGVYCFYDQSDKPLYVGKAKQLKNRVKSYFAAHQTAIKTVRMVQKARTLRIHIVRSEVEALILEQTLIKSLEPPYNILLRDDKSYPYIWVTTDHDYPRLSYYRGARPKTGRLFGPYPSGTAVRHSLDLLQKIFKVRQCEDSFFRNRSRPCLQFQINRCTAPCVNRISKSEYAQDVERTIKVLEGKHQEVKTELSIQMEAASEALDFEMAAELRDKVVALVHVQSDQSVEVDTDHSWDVVHALQEQDTACFNFVYIRGGRMIGSKAYFVRARMGEPLKGLVDSFLNAYYLHGRGRSDVPDRLWVNEPWAGAVACAGALNVAGKGLQVAKQLRGPQKQWAEMSQQNAWYHMQRRLSSSQTLRTRFEALAEATGLDGLSRVECFDVSHSSGEETIAVSVTLGEEGPIKSAYRRYGIRSTDSGDDYAAMAEAVRRRFAKVESDDSMVLPDLLLIDGGKGQLSAAKIQLDALGLFHLPVMGVAKGRERKDGYEDLIWSDGSQLSVPPQSVARMVIQQVRDEAHRFAITGHRTRRDKKRKASTLESIEGVGPKRRKALLVHFGGLPGIQAATVEALAQVPGISVTLAQLIHDRLRSTNQQ